MTKRTHLFNGDEFHAVEDGQTLWVIGCTSKEEPDLTYEWVVERRCLWEMLYYMFPWEASEASAASRS